MEKYINEIKELMENYLYIKLQIENDIAPNSIAQKMEFIEKSIKLLDGESHAILTSICFKDYKKAEIAKKLGITRQALYRKINNSIKKLIPVYKELFAKT
ncbi:MAG: hypothetical protein QM214_07400 [Bacillota bacterium]|jgi:transcriptional regulator with PAS, ATPase and Fis domain|nr:hypothetical protein [Candidatus Cloacimonadota bacterium]MDI9487710.1 hypothetical protein [Bacillota bacterium]